MLKIFMFLLVSSSTLALGVTLTQELSEKSSTAQKKRPKAVNDVMAKSLKSLKDSGIETQAVAAGVKAPDFQLNYTSFKNIYKKKPVILKFYRGSWCPYCQLELKAYEKYKKQMEAKGYQIIILTPDTKQEIRKFKDKQKITMDIYQDKDNHIAKKFGISFKISDELSTLYKGFGIDLNASQGSNANELPLPGTYVINTEGVIVYAFIDADYTKRLDPLVLLEVL